MRIDASIEKLMGELEFDPDALKTKYLEERDKRIRSDGIEQYVEVTAEYSRYVDDPYVEEGFEREPLFDEVEVVIIGGGFGGLLAGARLREAGFKDIRVIDRAGDFGGTWYWNRYPGAMCDVESYCYLPLLEELNYIPKHKYSFAPEILEHSRRIARHFNLYENACLQTSVEELRWDESSTRWIIKTDRGDRIKARYVAMATVPSADRNYPVLRASMSSRVIPSTPVAGTMVTPVATRMAISPVSLVSGSALSAPAPPPFNVFPTWESGPNNFTFSSEPRLQSMYVTTPRRTPPGFSLSSRVGNSSAWITSTSWSTVEIRKKILSETGGPTYSATSRASR